MFAISKAVSKKVVISSGHDISTFICYKEEDFICDICNTSACMYIQCIYLYANVYYYTITYLSVKWLQTLPGRKKKATVSSCFYVKIYYIVHMDL